MGIDDLQGQKNSSETSKNNKSIALFLAGMIAGVGAPDALKRFDNQFGTGLKAAPDSGSYQSYPADQGMPDYVSSDQQYSSDSGTFEFPSTLEALQAVVGLDKTVGKELRATPEQRRQIHEAVDAYVAAHPPAASQLAEQIEADEGKSYPQETPYNPLYDLWGAASKLGISSALRGVLLDELSERMGERNE